MRPTDAGEPGYRPRVHSAAGSEPSAVGGPPSEPGAYLAAHPGLRDCYVTHVHPVADVQAAFSAAITPRPGQLKIAVDMT